MLKEYKNRSIFQSLFDSDAGIDLQAFGQSLEQNPERLAEIKERLKFEHPDIAQVGPLKVLKNNSLSLRV